MSMIYPLARGLPINPYTTAPDYNCRDAPLYDGCGGGTGKTFPCGGYPPDKQVVQSFEAGQMINVTFGNAAYGSPGEPALTPTSDQARHSGGLCEFSLSYDQGGTFGVFARYHVSCPDMFYNWTIKLPDNLPACDNCILGWSWIGAVGARPEYYMGCADIKIVSTLNGSLPPELASTPLRMANMPGYPYYFAPGDKFGNLRGNGPNSSELAANMRGATGGPDTHPFPPGGPDPQPMLTKRKKGKGTRRML
ncbi:hypothetical protein BGZ54_009377 [Gamsiella multidivaricata]|nr:hypothetical protein BGZ54_009377 [Gamsiella multidivaricata]